MFGYFNKIRKKPKHVRDNVAFSIAGGFTAVIAIAWFFIGFSSPFGDKEISKEESPAAFSTLLNQIQEQVATARGSVTDVKEAASSTPVNTGEWGLSARNASTTSNSAFPQEAAIMIVSSATATATTSPRATSSVLY